MEIFLTMKKHLNLFFLFVTVFCFSQDKDGQINKTLVKMAIGETVVFTHVTIKFVEVLEDSRCPKDVNCMWEGQAIALMEVTETEKEAQQVELFFGKRNNRYLFSSEECSLKGVSLDSHPSSAIPNNVKYTLTVSEERN